LFVGEGERCVRYVKGREKAGARRAIRAFTHNSRKDLEILCGHAPTDPIPPL